ncbi:MAG: 30S ribosomal protein S6 [Negativicutes bacterium]|nr:30S ribosomal protein S6 [Negativicutes bacterium]
MRKYELIYIVKPQEEEAIEALVAKFDGIITDNGGTIEKTDRWGKRRLAYPIQDLTEGYYVLQHLVAEPAVINELDRIMKITDDLLRHMIVVVED